MIGRQGGKTLVGLLAMVTALAAAGTTSAQVFRQITDNKQGAFSGPAALDEEGPYIYAVSTTNQYGNNPDFVPQIFRWDPASGDGERITELVVSNYSAEPLRGV